MYKLNVRLSLSLLYFITYPDFTNLSIALAVVVLYIFTISDNSCCVTLFDIDDFKSISDGWGHDAGDRVLEKVAATANKFIRKHDVFARWGGEEFIILMPQTKLSGAIKAADKLRKGIEGIQYADIDRYNSYSQLRRNRI